MFDRSPGIRFACLLAVIALGTPGAAQAPWPAEEFDDATSLTHIEGSGMNDFWRDLSGAVWNPVTRTLWVCRNGPQTSTSKVWAITEGGYSGFQIDYDNGVRGEWTGFHDLEGLTQADWNEEVVYLIIEREEKIKELDVSRYGTVTINNSWDTRAYLPLDGEFGSEGITFVPDAHLIAAGFVDQSGTPYASTQGMGGLMFVGHQNGGAIYVFDLNRTTGDFLFVGEYRTTYTETAGLEFDRSGGLLYIWHGRNFNVLATCDLTSVEVPGEAYRAFTILETYACPESDNIEGIAIVSRDDGLGRHRSLFLTIDDGGADALLWFQEFTLGCEVIPAIPTVNEGCAILFALLLGGTGFVALRRRRATA